MNQNGIWLSILDYASVHQTSISTIRRAIKSRQIIYKEEGGKYFIWSEAKAVASERVVIEKLKRENQKLKEEIEDLKMLLAVLEKPKTEHFTLPPIPEI